MKHLNISKLLILLILSLTHSKTSQSQTDGHLHLITGQKYDNLPLYKLFQQAKSDFNIRFFYFKDSIPNITIENQEDTIQLISLLQNNLSPHKIEVTKEKDNYFLFKNQKVFTNLTGGFFKSSGLEKNWTKSKETDTTTEEFVKTYNDFINEMLVIGENHKNIEKDQYELKGQVVNAETREPISMATLNIEEKNKFTTTNISGEYSIKLEKGEYTLVVSNLGNYEKKYKIKILSDGTLNIELKTKTFMLDEAVVVAKKDHNVLSTKMGFEKIDPLEIKKMPVVMGEQDIVKVALMLPGVQSVSEISSGFNVRGSKADQNMFYLDNLPVYNVSHLFGLYTSFNSDIVDDFSLYKSNIPIEYGGKLASLFNMSAKNGNLKEFSARGGISPISSRLMVEGPIKKKKMSYLISGRTTYSDWLLGNVKNLDVRNSSASFSDLFIKLFYNPDSVNNFSFIAYGSQDNSDLAFGIKNKYVNSGTGINWTHNFNNNHWLELDLLNSNYRFHEARTDIAYQASKHKFSLNHSELKLNLTNKSIMDHTINYGFNSIYYQMINGDLLPYNNESTIEPVDFKPEQALKNSLFIGDEWDVNTKLTVSGGLRATIYSYLGPNSIYKYRSSFPREQNYITDTVKYDKYTFIKNYPRLDYRISGKYSFSNDLSIKASLNSLHQYMFMLSNNISISPTDKWKLCDPHIKPLEGQQISAGLYKNFGSNIETSLEGYYKIVNNVVEYKDGVEFLTNKTPETTIIQGNLNAYGFEAMIKKKGGILSGWLNYTYSNTSVKAVDRSRGEFVNNGLAYPANYDKPHAINLTMNYNAYRRINLTANVVYSTGRPITYPSSIYYQNGIEIVNFSKRNAHRISDYFRIDLSLNIEGNLRKNKLAHGSWSFSIYNLTARENPYAVYFKNEDGDIKAYRISILGTIIPSIKYNIKLGNYEN